MKSVMEAVRTARTGMTLEQRRAGLVTNVSPQECVNKAMKIPSEDPITDPADDMLGRVGPARRLARRITMFDLQNGLVVGVLGPWGSGKTTFVNFVRGELATLGVPILDFNPWMFSGAQALVDAFFVEISSQLKLKRELKEVGADLEAYGEALNGLGWIPLVGTWIDRARIINKGVAKVMQRSRGGISSRKAKIAGRLANLRDPIIVVLDDIDRLTTAEIRDVFKLIRLTASFPNVVYITAFDRARVEKALEEEGIRGRDYLEKILPLAIDIPVVPDTILQQQVFKSLNAAIEGVPSAVDFASDAWPDIFFEIIWPLIRNMRDVRRLELAVRITAGELEGQVQIVDAIALEAIRVFLPDTFLLLASSVNALTTTHDAFYGGMTPNPNIALFQAQVDKLVDSADDKAKIIKAMIQRLFPAANRYVGGSIYGSDWQDDWRTSRRVAHKDILNFYLERIASSSLTAFNYAEQAFEKMTDEHSLKTLLYSVDPQLRQDVLAALESFERKFTEDQVTPTSIVLLNMLPDIPEIERGMFDLGSGLRVSRITLRLLKVLPDQESVERHLSEIIPRLNSLSAKLQIISDVGYSEGRGAKLASREMVAQLERQWRADVRATAAADLSSETDLLRVMLTAVRETTAEEPPMVVDPSPIVTSALLRSAVSDVRSATLGQRAVRKTPRLAWDALVEIYGSESMLKTRLGELRATEELELEDLLALAARYESGWRPPEFGQYGNADEDES
ncbi:hypothetical protein MINTM008_50510 [Mycobacterium intracellulare]|uniref:KAP NTPase domain-containing protein n=4 Tax=Mycobacterium intracellulare TaxID=1767 RepID=H8IW62_MYCIA|nr:hypothetical protein OCU_47270 [Mycobacterium intracellulare ATCC 13950]BCO49109.1 hypothetical protein MINTM002_47830 [Mycobacterium intracellulare]BCO64888.1 hypothetical protein MINTM006_48380 [Mycobacterium intracellulare]BCO75716.1 hypothetical protein MINTM008_50510 [Mycobacterium intracellulare]BCO81178.1 hypothetical protein MINTM009_49600 [Mycobacterium intracellulare]